MFSPPCMITCCSDKSVLVLSLRLRPREDIVLTNVSSSCSPPKQEWTVPDWLALFLPSCQKRPEVEDRRTCPPEQIELIKD